MYGSVGDFFPFRISVMILFQPYRSLMLFTAPCNLAFLLYFLGIFAMSHTNFDIVFPCTLNHETRQISVGDMFFTVWDMLFNSSFISLLFSSCCYMIHLNRANFPNKFAHIILRVSEEFSVTSFKKHYYCSKISLENLKFHLKSFHGLDSAIFVHIDHVVVRGKWTTFCLPSEQSLIGKVGSFSSSLSVSIFSLQLAVSEGMFSSHL